MTDFKAFQTAIKEQTDRICNSAQMLFVTSAPKELVYEKYLDSYPDNTNPIYRERREFDCNCCRHFIRDMGNVVMIDENLNVTSIWDVEVPYPFNVVTKKLSEFVKSYTIEGAFLHFQKNVGQKSTREMDGTRLVTNWDHFYAILPPKFVSQTIASKLGEIRETRNVFKRAMEELTMDSYDTVLDLISQNSLYRGSEFKFLVEGLRLLKIACKNLSPRELELFYWRQATINNTVVLRARNTAIGTLLVDLSEGRDLEEAVASYERITAPSNYRRPTALVTKTMIDKAEKAIVEAGLEPALHRRFAVMEDITINNVLFANRDAKKVMASVFDELKAEVSVNPKTFDKVEEDIDRI